MRLTFCIALLFLSSLSSVQANEPTAKLTPTFPLEYYLKSSDYLNVQLSPDGKHYASLVRDKTSVYLLIKETATKKLVGGARPGSGNEIRNMKWVSNEHLIYNLGYEYRRDDTKFSRGELFMVNLSGTFNSSVAGYKVGTFGARRENKQRKAERMASYRVLAELPDDESGFLALAHPWKTMREVWEDNREAFPLVMRIGTSKAWINRVKRVEELPFKEAMPVVESNGQIRFLHYPNENAETATMYRETPDSKWVSARTVFGDVFSGKYPVSLNNSGDKLYLYGSDEEDSVETLFEYRFEDKTLHKVFESKVSISDWSVDAAGEPYVAYSYPGAHAYHYSKTNSDSPEIGIHQTFVQSFVGNEVRVLKSGNKSGKRVVFVSASNNPGEYYLYDVNAGTADFIQAYSSWIDPATLIRKQPVSYVTRDEVQINGYLSLPHVEGNQKQHPVVLLIHGGPHGVRDFPDYEDEVQLLVNQGFAVMQVNYRGSSGISRDFEEAGYKNWGKKIINDILDSHSFISKNPQLDERRVCILGASFGGYAALMALAKTQNKYKCAIASSGVFDLPLLYEEGDLAERESGLNFLNKVLGADIEDLAQYSPVNLAKNITEPVLLIHGARDTRAPIEHSLRMREALTLVGNEPEWIRIGSAGHATVSLKNRVKEFTNIISFLNQNLNK